MAVCLDYQVIAYRRNKDVGVSMQMQLIAAFVLLVALVAKVWVKVEITDLGYELAKQHNIAVELDMKKREAELKLSLLMRPDNLAAMAKKRLDLEPLNPKMARKLN